MQVIYRRDTNADGTIDNTTDDITSLTAANQGSGQEVRVYILAHEGQMDLVIHTQTRHAIPSSPSDPRIWTRKHIQLVVNYRINLYKLQVEDIHNSRETLEFRGMMRKMSAISKQKSANKSKLPSLVPELQARTPSLF